MPLPPRQVPKMPKLLLYASLQSSRGLRTLSCDAQATELVRVAALPCTREHRKINFHQKNIYDWEDFFSCFCRTEPNALFLQWIITLETTQISQFWLQTGQLHFCPQSGHWDPMLIQFDQIRLQFDPNRKTLGSNRAQYIYKLPINRPSGRYVILHITHYYYISFIYILG